ncbi:hypothetical protein LTR97_007167 [Elasticomyces elasticus]|uniref:Uncharacterized protein n=1 Tax=Elasticomyces elasticus TaxID=574655 RepID=A0AAN7WFP0_9PEZI|nr:hypothetical protein LTR97_007167 [Elasticomyces elasticus]
MADQQYERLSVFREATFRDHTQSRAAPGSKPVFNHKPRILRTLSLLFILLITLALIGLLQYAVIKLPHGDGSRHSLPGTSPSKRDTFALQARDDGSTTSSSVPSAATTLSAAETTSLPSFSLFVASTTSTASMLTASPTTSDTAMTATTDEGAYVSTDGTQTFSQSANTLFIVSQSDYVATDTTQTLSVIAFSANPSDYVSTSATQSITATVGGDQNADIAIDTSSVDQSNYVSTSVTQTLDPTIYYSTAPTAYISTDATQTLSPTVYYSAAATAYISTDATQTIALPTTYPTTIPSATVVWLPVTAPASSQITQYTQVVQQTTVSGVAVSTTISSVTVLNLAVSSAGSTPVTSWTEIVSAVTLEAGQQAPTNTAVISLTTVPSSTLIWVPATSGTGSVQIESYTQVVSAVTFSAPSEVTGGKNGATTATPTPNDASSMENQTGKVAYIAHHYTPLQTFFGTYMTILLAVIYRMIWTVVNNNFSLIEPFRQLNENSGALAERALFSFYQMQSNLLGPFPALLKRRWLLATVSTAYLVACLMPALSSEAIYVETDWGCEHPMEGKNPCDPRMTVDVVVVRVLQGLLAFAAFILLLMVAVLLLTRTGLPANPSSIATIASMMRNPALLDDLNEIPPDADAKHMRQALTGRRYKLDTFKTATGEIGYGIVPAYANGQEGHMHTPGYAPVSGTTRGSHAHRFRILDFVLAFVVLGSFGVVLAYYLDGKPDGFNNFFSSNTFGPRFILTGAATIVASLWKGVEQSALIVGPYKQLAHRPSYAKSTILFTPHNTPFLATISALLNRYFLIAIITFTTLTAEALNIVVSGVPYATGQTWMQFLVSIYMSMSILGFMIIVSAVVIMMRIREPKMPRKPDHIAAVMSYLSSSRLLHDFEGVDWQDGEDRDRRIQLVGKRYTFEQRRRDDGKHAWVVDEVME